MTVTGKIRAAAGFSGRPVRKKPHPALPHLRVVPDVAPLGSSDGSIGQASLSGPLSVRAENVLKILAPELTGEAPSRGRWTPSDLLLQRLTYKHLSTARNCGPQTIAEIVGWAQTRGTTIHRSLYSGKSLPSCGTMRSKSSRQERFRERKSRKRWRDRRAGRTRVFRWHSRESFWS